MRGAFKTSVAARASGMRLPSGLGDGRGPSPPRRPGNRATPINVGATGGLQRLLGAAANTRLGRNARCIQNIGRGKGQRNAAPLR